MIDDDGRWRDHAARALDAHRLIEEFMILANVCAAETLEQKRAPLPLPRPRPARARRRSRRCATSSSMSASAGAKGRRCAPTASTGCSNGPPTAPARRHGQRAGAAHPDAGGLQPRQSRPFRADPAALRALHLADPALRRPDRPPRADRRARARDGGAARDDASRRTPPSTISDTERRAAAAERDAIDRYVAAFCPTGSAPTFAGRISGVERFGLFATPGRNRRRRAHPDGPDGRWLVALRARTAPAGRAPQRPRLRPRRPH